MALVGTVGAVVNVACGLFDGLVGSLADRLAGCSLERLHDGSLECLHDASLECLVVGSAGLAGGVLDGLLESLLGSVDGSAGLAETSRDAHLLLIQGFLIMGFLI